VSDPLARTRARLDAVDDALLALLAERAALVAELAAWKADTGRPFRDPAREDEAHARLRAVALARGLDPDAVGAVFRQVIGKRLEGEPGPRSADEVEPEGGAVRRGQ
jgi:chorismate mutase